MSFLKNHLKNTQGQITILLGFFIVTMLLMFQFVVNTALLINAKINLQSAADMAAYAGAAVQARHLNVISFLNYEMRRQYKKFLFRYYVIGNMAQDSNPNKILRNDLRVWTPNNNPKEDYGVPAVCLVVNPKDNYCKQYSLSKITIPKAVSVFDSITKTLQAQLKELEKIRKNNCAYVAGVNKFILNNWLYATYPKPKALEKVFKGLCKTSNSSADIKNCNLILKALKSASALTEGIGLIPRLILLHERIKTHEWYVNYPPYRGLTNEKVIPLGGASDQGDQKPKERPVLAFKSALNTLGSSVKSPGHVFDDTKHIFLDELIPGDTGEPSNLLHLNTLKINFDAYYIEYNTKAKNCRGAPQRIPARNVPIGVWKDPTVLTYYAIRLKARAHLLFSPFGPLWLKAYSAAMPFGSRIGPPLKEKDFVHLGQKPSKQFICRDCVGIPNLPLGLTDSTARGWQQGAFLAQLFTLAFKSYTTKGKLAINKFISGADFTRAYQFAMAPNPWEGPRYNIPNDLGAKDPDDMLHLEGGDPFVDYFSSYPLNDASGKPFPSSVAVFWAPLISLEQKKEKLEKKILDLMENFFSGKTSEKKAYAAMIGKYIQLLRTQKGENDETLIASLMTNPFTYTDRQGKVSPLTSRISSNKFFMLDPQQVKTSWNGVVEDARNYRERGRVGYSVKFISFPTLMDKKGITTNGSDTWTNDLWQDEEASRDLAHILH